MTSQRAKIRFIIKQNSGLKNRFLKARIGFYVFFSIMVFITSISLGNFNILYYIQSVLKYVVCFSIFVAGLYLMVGDKETAENWQKASIRKKDIIGKLQLSILEGIIFLVIPSVILGIFYLTGFPYDYEQTYLAEHTGESPLRYIPTTVEAVLFSGIILLTIVSLFTSIYWFYSRCGKVIGYRDNEKEMKVDITRAMIGVMVNFFIWAVIIPVLDVVFFDIVYPERSNRFEFLKEISSSKPYLYLVIQLGFILLVNLYYVIDGLLANKRRKNFVKIDLTDINDILNF